MTNWLGTFLALSARSGIGERLFHAEPAWAWSRDGAGLAWANPAGARLLGLSNLGEMAAFQLPAGQHLRRDIANVARTLGPSRTLARLRFYKGARTIPLACQCERLRTGDGRTLVLVIALDAVGNTPASDDDLAAFLADGTDDIYVLDDSRAVLARNGADGDNADFSGLKAEEGKPCTETLADGRAVRHISVAGPQGPRMLLWAAQAAAVQQETAEPEPVPDAEEAARADETEEPDADLAETDGPDGGVAETADEAAGAQGRNLSEQARILRTALGMSGEAAEKEREPDTAWPVALDDLPKKPVRFLWQTDADDRFLFVSPGLEQLVGRSSQIVGERWADIAGRMRLDPVGRISQALAARDTWSGYTAWWPADDYNARIPAELTALPVFAMDQSFQGYRGFGVLKPAEALSEEAFDRRFPGRPDRAFPQEASSEEAPSSEPKSPRLAAPAKVVTDRGGDAGSGGKVVPIRNDIDHLPDFARLSAQERSAFDEIASALRTHHEAGRAAAGAQQLSPDQAGEHEQRPESEDAHPGSEEGTPETGLGEIGTAASEGSAAGGDYGDYSTDAEDPDFLASLPDDDDDYPPDIDETWPDDLDDVVETQPESEKADEVEEATEEAGEPDQDTGEPEEEAEAEEETAAPPVELVAPEPANDDQAIEPDDLTAGEKPADELGGDEPGDAERRVEELTAILDTATDGVVIVDHAGRIISLNASAEAVFGRDEDALRGSPFADLLGDDSRQAAVDYLDGLRENGVASVLNEGREVSARSGEGEIPLFMTMGHIGGSGDDARFCAVLRDISQWKRTEAELIAGRESAEKASEQKSDFLARVSHEIRTPLNAIIGFAEVMIEERFGPVENDRYREYLRDIRTSGEHVVSLVNDLLDISKIEAGKLELTFSAVQLNDLIRECVALMQPQANRAQVIVRSSLAADLPAIVADPRTMRQVVLNLVSNSVKFTGPGGQVIVSTTLADTGEAVLRVRDTGSGMSEEDLARALEPFRQLSTSRISDENGTGLGLPLTKALVEANRAEFSINSARGEGTIVQVTFPATRVLSE
jgi:PAS domain S-box-containing protein